MGVNLDPNRVYTVHLPGEKRRRLKHLVLISALLHAGIDAHLPVYAAKHLLSGAMHHKAGDDATSDSNSSSSSSSASDGTNASTRVERKMTRAAAMPAFKAQQAPAALKKLALLVRKIRRQGAIQKMLKVLAPRPRNLQQTAIKTSQQKLTL